MTKVPAYRFNNYIQEWGSKKLSDVATYKNGKAHEKDISTEGEIIVVNSKFISSEGSVKKYTDKVIEPLFEGDITFVLSDVPNGKALAKTFIILEDKKYSLNQRIARITPKEGNSTYFLNFIINRNKYFLAFDNGVGQTNLSRQEVEDFNFSLPTLPEQTAIGNFFQTLDRSIALHQRKLDALKEQKKTYLQKLFPRNGETIPEIRLHGFEGGWGKANLGDFLKEYNEKSVKENQYDVLSSTNNGIEERSGRVSGESNIGYKILKKEMIVLSPQNLWLGNINYNSYYNIGLVSPSYKIYDIQNIDKLFMSVLIRHPYMYYEYGQASVQGASIVRRNLDLELFKTIQILVPPLSEQTAIGNFFQTLDRSIAQHQTKLDKLKESKQTLLKKMFV